MTREQVEILSDDEEIKSNDETEEKSLVYRHKNGTLELHPTSLECLHKGSYLKDDVVQFYFTYLFNEVCCPSVAARVHIFDSIFYDKMYTAFEGEKVERSEFMKLRRWHSGLDIFNKDFLIFPICYEDHWIVVVVCYAAAVQPVYKSESSDEAHSNTPGIVIMDSLDLRGPKKVKISLIIRDFLDYNWRSTSRPIKRFSHYDMADHFPRLPRQTNHFDCGLYMLMYVKCFLDKPDEFYQAIKDQSLDTHCIDSLSLEIERAVEENNREIIKAQINRLCS